MKRWTQIFKALGNLNRLKILEYLTNEQLPKTVGEIAKEIHVTFKGTSRHLIILHSMGFLDNEGKAGHVYYYVNKNLPPDLKKALHLFLN